MRKSYLEGATVLSGPCSRRRGRCGPQPGRAAAQIREAVGLVVLVSPAWWK